MKPVLVLLLASCLAAFGQPSPGGFISPAIHDRPGDLPNHEAERELREAQKAFTPKDPWRTIKGTVRYAKGDGWLQFYGRVIGQSAGKTYVHGWCGSPLEYEKRLQVFCVTNLPALAAGEVLLPEYHLTALNTFIPTTYYSAEFGEQPCMMLDYGVVWTPPPPSPAELIAAKAQADAAKKKADDAALKYDQELAAKGDAYGELRMGERYRDGDKVAKDLVQARTMLSRSAHQGNAAAASALATFPAQ